MLIGYDASRALVREKTGTETYAYQLLKALINLRSPHYCKVYTRPNTKLSISEYEKWEEVPINWPYLWTQGGLALETWKKPPDVLFVPAHVVPLLKNPRVPVVVTVHDLALDFLPHYQKRISRLYLGWFMERLRARLSTHIIAVSEATKKDVIEKLHVSDDKVSVVYEGVGASFQLPISQGQISKVKEKYGLKGEYLLFVGTLQPRKNIARLIEAFSIVLPKLPVSSTSLVIAGKKGWNYEGMLAAPKKFGVEDKVRFLNYVPAADLPSLYAGARVFCLPSLHEGFGLPVLESLAIGTPTVVSRTPALTEIGGEVAVGVGADNADDIARGILEICLWNNEMRNKKIIEGKKWAAGFTWGKAAKKTLQIIEKVVKSKADS